MGKLYLRIVLLLIARLSQAQAVFQPGYIISPAGDTTRGLVATQNGQRSTQSCRFRPTSAAEETTYTSAQLRAYGGAGQQYEAHPVATAEQQIEPRFLAVVERGPVSLFLLVDTGGRERYFINGSPGFVIELRRVVQARPDLGSTIFQTHNYYQDDLRQAFQACPDVQQRVKQVSFSLPSLQEVVRRYNSCQQPAGVPQPVSRPGGQRRHLRLSAVLGLPVYNVLRLGEGQGRVPADDEIKGRYYLNGGLLLSTTGTYHNSHVSFATGLLFEVNRAYHAQKVYPNLSYNLYYQNSQVDVSFNYLKVPLLVRYRFAGAFVRPYVEAGIYLRTLLSMSRNEATDNYAASIPSYTKTYDLLNPRQLLSPLPALGAGLQLGHADGRWLTLSAQAELLSGPQVVGAPQNYADTSRLLALNILLAYDLLK